MPNGNKTDNGVLEIGTDEIVSSFKEDTPGENVKEYLAQARLANEEKKSERKKNFSQVFDNPLKGFPYNEEIEVTPIKEGNMQVEGDPYVPQKKGVNKNIANYWNKEIKGLTPKELEAIQSMYMITDHSGVVQMYKAGKRDFIKSIKEEVVLEDYKKVIKMYPRDNDWKKLITKHKRAIDDFRKNNKDLPSKVEDELLGWASQTGEVGGKDDAEDFIMSILDESTISENYRVLAKHGMGAETKNSIKVGTEVDYYQKDGAKYMGKITKMTPKGYIVRDDKTKKEHEFTYHDRNAAKKLLKQGDNLGEGSMEGQKLTGQEVSTYFRKNPTKDKDTKKAIEIALDHGGAMNYAIKQIEKFKKGFSKKKEVQKALQYANEEVKYKLNVGVVFTEDTHPCKGLSEDDPCWKDYKQVGMKKMNGKEVPNCVPKEGVMDDEPLKDKYPFQKKFSVESTFREMFEEELKEETIVYKVKGIQKPETDKFNQSAKLMKLKVSFKKEGSDTHVTMTGNKKQLRDFDSIARGKSSYGDPSTIKHFDESLEEAISRDKNLSKKDIDGIEDHIVRSYINKKTLSKISFDDDEIFHAGTGKTIFTSKDYIGKMTIDDLIKALEKKVK